MVLYYYLPDMRHDTVIDKDMAFEYYGKTKNIKDERACGEMRLLLMNEKHNIT